MLDGTHSATALVLPLCPGCNKPAHAAETDDNDFHPRCRNAVVPATPSGRFDLVDIEAKERAIAARRPGGFKRADRAWLRTEALKQLRSERGED